MKIVIGTGWDPYWNLATENALLDGIQPGEVVMYLWHNRRTVVIGRNQNPYAECDLDALQADGGHLARRTTGGGAVYHDEGNLNFSFIASNELYDQSLQFDIIARAIASYGLTATRSGRNDMLCDGRKFSGNAFSKTKSGSLHHGTILVGGDQAAMQKYLRPNTAKLLRHGVQSVRSRVVNLSELADVTLPSLKEQLVLAAEELYHTSAEIIDADALMDRPKVIEQHDMLASDAWLYDPWRNFNAQYKGHWDWGSAEIELTCDSTNGTITHARIASDSLMPDAIAEAERNLIGMSTAGVPPINSQSTPTAHETIVRDILDLIRNQ